MHHVGMRTHRQIIQLAGAATVIERAALPVSLHTVRSWQQRDAIPGEYWAALAGADIATLPELAHAAAARRAANDLTSQDKAA